MPLLSLPNTLLQLLNLPAQCLLPPTPVIPLPHSHTSHPQHPAHMVTVLAYVGISYLTHQCHWPLCFKLDPGWPISICYPIPGPAGAPADTPAFYLLLGPHPSHWATSWQNWADRFHFKALPPTSNCHPAGACGPVLPWMASSPTPNTSPSNLTPSRQHLEVLGARSQDPPIMATPAPRGGCLLPSLEVTTSLEP